MPAVTPLSVFTLGVPPLLSRNTVTVTLPSGTSRSLVVFGVYGNPSNTNTPMSGNTTPTFGGIQMSEVTRPTGGTNVFQSMTWITPISDGSSGNYDFVAIKQTTTDTFEGVGIICSNVSSIVSSIVSTNLTAGPLGLNQGNIAPVDPSNDLWFGAAFSASATTNAQTQTGEGTAVVSNITPGGNTGGQYTPALSVVSSQGDSSISYQWTIPSSQRWRVHALGLRTWGAGSQITAAGTVVSSATTASTTSSVCSVTVQKDGSTNQVVMVFVSGYDAAGTGVRPVVRVDGSLADLIAENSALDPPGSETQEVRCTAWLKNVSGTGSSEVSVACNGAVGVTGLVMVGVDQGNPVSQYSTNGNNFSLGPMTSSASASYGTQQAIGFGCSSFSRIITGGSNETVVSNASWGPASPQAQGMAQMVSTKDCVVPLVSFADSLSAAGRWRHTTIVLNLDGNIPPDAPPTAVPYFYRRRSRPSDW